MQNFRGYFQLVLSAVALIFPPPSLAQIVPDTTLPQNSRVSVEGQLNQITGGTVVGGNLFHSFREFSVPTGVTAHFDHPLTIQNIFSRVTGGSISNIDGIIKANGRANLFLLNPKGILFGPNARLDVGGSFLATTADSIVFSDQITFSATNPQASPLLTINVPIGLQFGSNPQPIKATGPGHNFTRPNPIFGEIQRPKNSPTGLQVPDGQTLALVGGDLLLEGALLQAAGGQIELGSVNTGVVNLNPTPAGWRLSYQQVPSFRDIQLSQVAGVDTTGNGGGITVQGRNITLKEGSVLLLQNLGEQAAGQLTLNASETLEINGISPDARIRTTIASEALAFGSGANLTVNAKQLSVVNGAAIYSATYGPAVAGDLTINASEAVEVSNFSPLNPLYASLIAAPTYSQGQGGNITVRTQRFSMVSGGSVFTSTFGTANSGDITVEATESVTVKGATPLLQPSNLITGTFNEGMAGTLRINTGRLTVQNGGVISGGTSAAGNAGSVIVNASESIEVSGISPNSVPTSISSAAEVAAASFRRLARLPDRPTGDSGDVIINTPHLRVENQAVVNVRNLGTGRAGTLQVNADSISLSDVASITAATRSGEGGNIVLQTRNLQLRKTSQITATAGGSGNGGNLTMNTGAIAALENSEISANAIQGQGGNIQITTSGLFRSGDTRVTASSQFGLAGAVQLTTPNFDPSSGLVDLPETVVDASALIGRTPGRPEAESSFMIIGRGGLPANPDDSLNSSATVIEWARPGNQDSQHQDFSGRANLNHRGLQQHSGLSSPRQLSQEAVIEATGWTTTDQGQVLLTTKVLNTEYRPHLETSHCDLPGR